MLTMIGAIGRFEREMMLQRHARALSRQKREEIQRTKADRRAKADEVKALHGQGIGPTEIAKRLGWVGRHLYRILSAGLNRIASLLSL